MPITINGSGTVTGITAGGLPDGVITTDDIAAGAVTDAKVNASAAIADSKLSGTTCKAWVNFNGTSTVAIRASYNVSSITDNGTGDYTVNFTTALADANYSVATNSANSNNGLLPNIKGVNNSGGAASNMTTTACTIVIQYAPTAANFDATVVTAAFFR